MGDRNAISREGWPPSSSTADRRHLHIRLPGAPEHLSRSVSSLDSQRQHAHFQSEATSISRITERIPSWSASEAIDTGLHSKPRVRRRRVRAEDLWDRDEEELLQQRASRFAFSVSAEAGEKMIQQKSSLPQNLDSFGAAGDDLLSGGPIEGRGQRDALPEADALNHAEDNISSRSPESQSRQQAQTQPEVYAVNYAEDTFASRSPESQGHPDLKRLHDGYLDDFSTTDNTEFEPQKRRRINTGRTEPSTVDGDLPPEKASQDALANVLLKRLVEEHGKTRAVKAELERYKELHGAIGKVSEVPKRRKRPNYARQKRREHLQVGRMDRTTISADTPTVSQEPDDTDRLATFTKFESLPDNVQDIAFGMLLEKYAPIKLNNVRLKAFVESSVGVPDPTWTFMKSRKSPRELQIELDNMKANMSKVPRGEWPSDSVVGGLTLSILLVSKAMHRKAARCLYGNNVFEFSDARDAWLHLESFLNTIGSDNVTNMQHLSVAMPKWSHGPSDDKISVALLNALSPITRLAILNNAAEDPLLSAISSCTSILAGHGGLQSFQINMLLHQLRPFIKPHLQDSLHALSTDEHDKKFRRRNDGLQLLRALDGVLGPKCKTELVIHAAADNNKSRYQFRYQLRLVQLEAKKYGWDVNRKLRVDAELKMLENQ